MVEYWSYERHLHQSDSKVQMLKVFEEVAETASAISKNKPDDLRDGIGDVVVTLIILAQQNGMTLEECLQMAYDEIKGRTGTTVDGVFIKQADL